jgi:hypothetical protein
MEPLANVAFGDPVFDRQSGQGSLWITAKGSVSVQDLN